VTGNSILKGDVDLGDATDGSDIISIKGRINTDLVPSGSTRDIGSSTNEWRNLFLDGTAHIDTLDVDGNAGVIGQLTVTGLLDANGGAHIDNLRLGIDADNDITTSSGNLTLDSASGTVRVNDNLTVDGTITGNGSGLTSLNASNISSGTINDARLPGTITSNITGNAASSDSVDVTDTSSSSTDHFPTFVTGSGSATIVRVDNAFKYKPSTNTLTAGTFSGSGSGLTNLNASQISSGTINDARLPGTITSNITGTATQANNVNIDETNTDANFQVVFSNTGETDYERLRIDTDNSHFLYNPNTQTLSGCKINCLSGSTLRGDGSNITSLNASQLSSGTVPLARLGSGTKNSTTFLAGDNTFRTVVVAINTLNSAGNNRVITSSGGSTANAESNLTFDGSTLGVSGAITCTGNITAFTSDIRLKTEIQPIENAVAKLLKLNGFTYEHNELAESLGYERNGERFSGVSAQDVKEVLPEAVKPAPANADYMTVQYEKLVPLLIEAIKELKAEIDELKK